jgi:class 3 adenylate cyclase
VTFLLTDIEGSTRLWEDDAEAMPGRSRARSPHRDVRNDHDGVVVVRPRGEGDSRFVVFAEAAAAVAAAYQMQRALLVNRWPTREPVRVRIGLHAVVPSCATATTTEHTSTAVLACAELRTAAKRS